MRPARSRAARLVRALALLLVALLALPPSATAAPAGRAWYVVEPATGRVLAQHNADLPYAPASLTKMLTALVVREQLKLNDRVRFSPIAATTPADHVTWSTGLEFSVEDLLYALLLESSNGAAVALAERISGTEVAFVHLMNAKARFLGVTGSWWMTAHGLDMEGQGATARDLATIAKALLDDPVLAKIVRTRNKTVRWGNGRRTFSSRDGFIANYPGAIGVKMGVTTQARTAIAAAAKRDDRVILAVVLRSPSAAADAVSLLDKAFRIPAGFEPPRGGIDVPSSWFAEVPESPLPEAPDELTAAGGPREDGTSLGIWIAWTIFGLASLGAGAVVGKRRGRQAVVAEDD